MAEFTHEQKVKLSDGRVGNVIGSLSDDEIVVRVGAIVDKNPSDPNDTKRIAVLEDVVVRVDDIETNWTETDVHWRVWDQDGKLVGFEA